MFKISQPIENNYFIMFQRNNSYYSVASFIVGKSNPHEIGNVKSKQDKNFRDITLQIICYYYFRKTIVSHL